MAPRTTTPGLRAATHPIGHTSWGPIYRTGGGRVSARGVDFAVGDDEGPDDDDFDDDEGDDDQEDRAAERQRERDRRDAARGWQKPKPKQRRDQLDEDDDGDEPDDEQDEPDDRATQRRSRGKRGSAEDTDEWVPPSREQWESVTAAVKRNNDENFKRRYVAKAMKKLGIEDEDGFRAFMLDRGLDPDSGERIGGDGEGDDGVGGDELFDQSQDETAPATRPRSRADVIAERRRHEERGRTRAEQQYKPGMALFAAEAELRAQGFTGRDISLAIRLIDPEEIEVDFDENSWPVVHGLTEQVEKIKEGVPEWFRQPRAAHDDEDDEPRRERARPTSRRRVGGVREVDGGERRRPTEKPMTWIQKADAQMMGRRL
jgi:hypothetical protein